MLRPRSEPSPMVRLMSSDLYPQARMTSSIPPAASDLSKYHRHGLSATGRMILGFVSVSGRSLVPLPPTMTAACLTLIFGPSGGG